MRGTKAKALRRKIYGTMSHKTREYQRGHEPRKFGLLGTPNPTCLLAGLRQKYQDAKRNQK